MCIRDRFLTSFSLCNCFYFFILPDDTKFPVEFYGVKGVETLSKENPSYENVAEATEILLLIRDIIKVWADRDVQFNLSSICVVSFYPGQVSY